MEHEGLGFAEAVDDAVQKADKKRGVEAHRARGVEQHDETQRLDLAPAPGELDQRAAMGDVAVDGAAQIEPAAAAADLLAADEPRAHGAGKTRGKRMGCGDFVGIGDVAQVGCRQHLRARSAFAAAAASRGTFTVAVMAPLDAIGMAERFLRHLRFGKPARRPLLRARGAGQNLPLAHAFAAPIGIKDLVETFPVRMRGAEQRAKRGLERCGL